MRAQASRRGLTGLIYDVSVNLLANLLAAAVIYGCGAIAGYWRANYLLATSVGSFILMLLGMLYGNVIAWRDSQILDDDRAVFSRHNVHVMVGLGIVGAGPLAGGLLEVARVGVGDPMALWLLILGVFCLTGVVLFYRASVADSKEAAAYDDERLET
jgi:hypothetical protein